MYKYSKSSTIILLLREFQLFSNIILKNKIINSKILNVQTFFILSVFEKDRI